MTGYPFEADTVYYSVVQAFNMAGLQSTEYSDGFKVDNVNPLGGVVHDGQGVYHISHNNIVSVPYLT